MIEQYDNREQTNKEVNKIKKKNINGQYYTINKNFACAY